MGLGGVAEARGDAEAAIAAYRTVATRWPDRAAGHLALGRVLLSRSHSADALTHLRWAAELAPDDAGVHLLLGLTHRDLGDLEAALAAFERAAGLDPKDPRARAERAGILLMRGEHDTAWALVAPPVEKGDPSPDLAAVYAELSPRHGKAPEAAALLERRLADRRLAPVLRARLHHVLGDLRAREGDDEAAFAHHRRANEARPAAFDAVAHAAWTDRMIGAFDPARLARLPKGSSTSPLPVFVVGMPRSGTSLVEQILARHPEAAAAGELPAVQLAAHALPRTLGVREPYPECVADLDRHTLDRLAEDYLGPLRRRFPEARRVTDKMPQNFLHLGLIALMLPRARVVHCVRDPVDTCLSIYFTMLSEGHPYARDLTALGLYYRQYERLMAHWTAVLDVALLTLRYEDLVARQEEKTRELLEFAGLRWDPACLSFHEADRDVGTASFDQVRRPIYNTSVGRWKRYERQLGPLLEALGRAAPAGPAGP